MNGQCKVHGNPACKAYQNLGEKSRKLQPVPLLQPSPLLHAQHNITWKQLNRLERPFPSAVSTSYVTLGKEEACESLKFHELPKTSGTSVFSLKDRWTISTWDFLRLNESHSKMTEMEQLNLQKIVTKHKVSETRGEKKQTKQTNTSETNQPNKRTPQETQTKRKSYSVCSLCVLFFSIDTQWFVDCAGVRGLL